MSHKILSPNPYFLVMSAINKINILGPFSVIPDLSLVRLNNVFFLSAIYVIIMYNHETFYIVINYIF